MLCGLTRELWDHTVNFAELQSHLESYRRRDMVNHATTPLTLGQNGWV